MADRTVIVAVLWREWIAWAGGHVLTSNSAERSPIERGVAHVERRQFRGCGGLVFDERHRQNGGHSVTHSRGERTGATIYRGVLREGGVRLERAPLG